MTDKKIKILYDTSFISFATKRDSNRSGIYFVAFNILQEFLKHPELDITIYSDYKRYWYLKDIIHEDKTLQSLEMLDMQDIAFPLVSQIAHIGYLCRKEDGIKDNFLKKTVRFFVFRFFHLYDKLKFTNPKLVKEIDNYDAFFSPYYIIPEEIRNNEKIKRFLFLHDMIPVKLNEFYGSMNFAKKWYEKLLASLNKQDYYFANSQTTKEDFIEYAPSIDGDKIFVTYLGANENFYQEKNAQKIAEAKKKYNIPQDKKYIFSLCTLEPRKNLVFAVKNFIEFIKKNSIDDFVFVLGGGHWNQFLPQLEKEISDLKDYQDKILKIGYVADEDLAALYSGAEMFVYPSIYEGFGMPVLEAMQCGCPVITSNVSSLPEVIGECGIQINPKEGGELLAAYEKMYYDREFRNKCSEKGLLRAKQFSWKICTDKILTVIKDTLSS